jgi:hypothetical protein
VRCAIARRAGPLTTLPRAIAAFPPAGLLISYHPKPMPQLAQGRELGEAEKPEGIAMLRLAFQRADHERAGEALTEAHALGAIKIAAA